MVYGPRSSALAKAFIHKNSDPVRTEIAPRNFSSQWRDCTVMANSVNRSALHKIRLFITDVGRFVIFKIFKEGVKKKWTGLRAYNSRCRAARVKRLSSAESS